MTQAPPGSGPRRAAPIDGDLGSCWLCGRAVSPRALFCHQCGTIQPPAALDAFARLTLPRRFDLEPAELERQHAGFHRVLDPARFEGRGPREKAMAQAHRDALDDALAELRDPMRRAALLLKLAGVPVAAEPLSDPWAQAVAAAGDAAALDRTAAEIGREREAVLRALSAAFRREEGEEAAVQLGRLRRLQAAAEAARRRRRDLTPPPEGG
ncbi:hypothetical protein [Rhodospirillum centenum]|uniref:DnaJ family, molecular chaperone, putative n=1 Tax=Rhodospirillum centenum (strain ATCC 51521 / SW) TaxID=414684 RepID=B6INC0_RHOCS|nr:hypothetical protein [Rhodospirillum centenum]ACI99017.1 DnaJ family, molecular chaperone, putative [Rhodospirillum centenum SW]